jgi:NAD-dependent deacetylase
VHLVVLTGAGMSAESGIATFRDSNGLWEGHDVMEVASPEGWQKDQNLVLDFYNQRRKNLFDSKPNEGHFLLKKLEKHFDVSIITQNVDDLHERAESSKVLHLHGQLREARSTSHSNLIYKLKDWELKKGDLCEKGSQLRPNIVWFGESVPNMKPAIELCQQASILLIIGTSLLVYPAASLYNYLKSDVPIYLIDPKEIETNTSNPLIHIKKGGTEGLKEFFNIQKLKL